MCSSGVGTLPTPLDGCVRRCRSRHTYKLPRAWARKFLDVPDRARRWCPARQRSPVAPSHRDSACGWRVHAGRRTSRPSGRSYYRRVGHSPSLRKRTARTSRPPGLCCRKSASRSQRRSALAVSVLRRPTTSPPAPSLCFAGRTASPPPKCSSPNRTSSPWVRVCSKRPKPSEYSSVVIVSSRSGRGTSSSVSWWIWRMVRTKIGWRFSGGLFSNARNPYSMRTLGPVLIALRGGLAANKGAFQKPQRRESKATLVVVRVGDFLRLQHAIVIDRLHGQPGGIGDLFGQELIICRRR